MLYYRIVIGIIVSNVAIFIGGVSLTTINLKLDTPTICGRPTNEVVQTEDGKSEPFYAVVKECKKNLKSFEGFNVCDYFILRKSLLTPILAQFITYCIVLLQFKVSEK